MAGLAYDPRDLPESMSDTVRKVGEQLSHTLWKVIEHFGSFPKIFLTIQGQGWQDSNPQPAVLETAALPVELQPSGAGPLDSAIHNQASSRKLT